MSRFKYNHENIGDHILAHPEQSYPTVAKIFACSPEVVWAIAYNELGIRKGSGNGSRKNLDYKAIVAYAKANPAALQKDIAFQFNTSQCNVSMICRRAGLVRGKGFNNGTDLETYGKIKDAIINRRDLNYTEIGKMFGYGVETVAAISKKEGGLRGKGCHRELVEAHKRRLEKFLVWQKNLTERQHDAWRAKIRKGLQEAKKAA